MPRNETNIDVAWDAIFNKYKLHAHRFDAAPFDISAGQIKAACQHFTVTGQKEVRILCTQTAREKRPRVFKDNGLFLLPVKNGFYKIIRGEGYVDIPAITAPVKRYNSGFDFVLESCKAGDSEMQHLDYAYAVSLIRRFTGDDSLVLTIRGRKYTPEFSFKVGKFSVSTASVQTEVDSGYEGRDRIVIIEAKNSQTTNTIIRQLYYPYRQWRIFTGKDVSVLFFEKRGENEYHLWEFEFADENDYNSIRLKRSGRYAISTVAENR